MSGMAKTESQAHHRKQYREAVEHIGWKPHIVVDNVVCAGTSIESGRMGHWLVHVADSARDGAEQMLRESGRKLARLWGIS
jgi:hypothetical protein